MPAEVFGNSPTPGAIAPVATLTTPITSSATSFSIASPITSAALRAPGGQFHALILDPEASVGEIVIIPTQSGTAITGVTRAASAESVAVSHPAGASIYPILPAEALDNAFASYATLGTDGTVGGPSGSPVSASVVSATEALFSYVPVADGSDNYTWTAQLPISQITGLAQQLESLNQRITALSETPPQTQPQRCLNAHVQFATYPDGELDQQLIPALLNTTAQAVRIDMRWDDMQPTGTPNGGGGAINTTYLARFDYVFQTLATAGIKVLLMVSYTPAWAQPSGTVEPNAPPTHWVDYINFVETIVARYSVGGAGVPTGQPSALEAFEFWNEPDQGYSWDTALNSGSVPNNAAAYVAGLKLVYPALKTLRSSLLVAAPAVGYSTYETSANAGNTTYDWLTDFFAADPQGYYDVLSLHCYGDPPDHNGSGDDTPADTVATWLGYVGGTIQSNDPTAVVWVTEIGWNTDGVTDAVQAQYVTQTYAAMAAVTAFNIARGPYWYELQDSGSPNDYGLVDASYNPKPSLVTFEELDGVYTSSYVASAITRVQQATQTATAQGLTGSTLTATFTQTPTVGNMLIALFTGWPTGSTAGNPQLPSGWTLAATAYNSEGDMTYIAYRKAQSGDGTAFTFGYDSCSGQSRALQIQEVEGLTTGTLDVAAPLSGNFAYSASSPLVTVSGEDEYVVAVLERTGALATTPSAESESVSAAWSLGSHLTDGSNSGLTEAYATAIESGSYGVTFTSSGVIAIAAFK